MKRRFFVKNAVAGFLLLFACNSNTPKQFPLNSLQPLASTLPPKIVVTQDVVGPYPKTGVTLMTFPLYNGCPDEMTVENMAAYQACVTRWLEVSAQLLTDLEVDVFRVPFGARAGNEIVGPDLLVPLAAPRPPFQGRYFENDTMMIGWPEADALAQQTGAEVMWVLNVTDIAGVGTPEQARELVQALSGQVRFYELGSEVFRPSLLNAYQDRITRFGDIIQQEDPLATYAAVLRDDFVWPNPPFPFDAHWWKNGVMAVEGPHRLQRHLYFPGGSEGVQFHRQGAKEAQFIFPITITQSGTHTLILHFAGTDFSPDRDVTITAGTIPFQWDGNGFTADLSPGEYEVVIASQTDKLFTLDYLFDLITPDTTLSGLSVLEGRSGWELYMAGADAIGPDLIPQNTGDRKIWVSEISELGGTVSSAADGQWGHRWLDALAYASGFMQAAADPRVEIILGHTLYEVPWFGMVSGVGRAPWQPWTPGADGVSMIAPQPRPKFWVHQQMARHMKNGQQLMVQMPIDYYQLDGGVQMGYSGREPQQIPQLECWGSDLESSISLLCINRSYDRTFTYPVEVEDSLATTAEMTLLVGQPGDNNEGNQIMIAPQSQSVSLSNVIFPPRSLVRLEIAKSTSQIYLPLIEKR